MNLFEAKGLLRRIETAWEGHPVLTTASACDLRAWVGKELRALDPYFVVMASGPVAIPDGTTGPVPERVTIGGTEYEINFAHRILRDIRDTLDRLPA